MEISVDKLNFARRTMATIRPKRDEDREKRITMEIIVDAYDAEEQAMGWYYYLEDQLQFPFTAVCVTKRATSPLHVKQKVKVIDMAPESECLNEMMVLIQWKDEDLAVPLSQLIAVNTAPKRTKQAIEDWHYWVKIGYQF